MCGICGIIDYTGKPVQKDTIQEMCSHIRHRGPDDEGIYISNSKFSVGLGHRRLSIIDLSASGHQPMSNEDGTIWIVFNGEIYNFKDLRHELENQGHIFKSDTDTETIIHLYEEYGIDCVRELRGMFAFAIWDEKKESLFMARDRLGKKPLLYYQDENNFCFASEFTALLASGLIKRQINPEVIDYYLTFGYIPAPLAVYKGVFKLLPGHTLILRDRNIALNPYWQLDYSKKINISEEEAGEEILRLLKEAVRIRLYSDVPLGAFLSGGIDSSTVVALMSGLSGKRVKTFSIGFEEKDYSELKYARKVAERFNSEHNEFIVKPKALEILPILVERYGEPYADSSCIPSYYVSRETRRHVTVALNGDGGDELFAGYERYQAILASEVYQKAPLFLRGIVNGTAGLLPDSVNPKNRFRRLKRFLEGAALPLNQRYVRWVGIFSENLKKNLYSEDFSKTISSVDSQRFIGQFLSDSNGLSLTDALLYTDTLTYLPNDLLVKMDIASMANSLEARSPFLDHKLIEFVAKLLPEFKLRKFVKKYILKKVAEDMIPKENIHRKKMGFGVPVGEWFRNELKDFLQQTLTSKGSLGRGYFKPEAVKEIVRRHIERQKDYSFQLWSLLMLELWHKRFMD